MGATRGSVHPGHTSGQKRNLGVHALFFGATNSSRCLYRWTWWEDNGSTWRRAAGLEGGLLLEGKKGVGAFYLLDWVSTEWPGSSLVGALWNLAYMPLSDLKKSLTLSNQNKIK